MRNPEFHEASSKPRYFNASGPILSVFHTYVDLYGLSFYIIQSMIYLVINTCLDYSS